MDNIARPRLTLLTERQIEMVHEASLVILAKSGLRVDSERADAIYAARAHASMTTACTLPASSSIAAIETAPATIDIFDRAGQPAFRLGDGETRFGVGGHEPLLPGSGDRRAHSPSAVAHGAGCPPLPGSSELRRDLDPRSSARSAPQVADLYAVLEMVANSTKPLVLLISDEKLYPQVLKLLDAVRGDLGEKPFAIPYLNPITPLVVNEGTTDKLLDSVERSIPAIYSNYGMAGMTTPLTCAGALAFLNAELLGGLTLSQLAKPGAPIILGSLPMFFDMKTMIDFYDPQTILINLACAEMMAHYEIPHAGTSGSGDGWGPDLLSAGSCWMNQITSLIGKVGLAPFVGSTLNSKAYSPAMTVYGDEVIGASRLFAKGFVVDEASLGATEAVETFAEEGHFLMAPSTLDRYKNAYYPSLFPKIGLEKWVEIGSPRADSLVRERALDLLLNAPGA